MAESIKLESPASQQPDSLLIANLEIREPELQVLVDGLRADLTVREFQLLRTLATRTDVVLRRPQIYELIWGGTMPARDRSVDVLVRRVRNKLARCAPEWRYIHTHFGIGYRFMPERGGAANAATG